MNFFRCDICGKETMVNPPIERLMEDKKIERDVPYTVTNPKTKEKKLLYKRETVIQKVPKMSIMKRMNAQTGAIEEVPVPATRDLKPRAIIVSLSVGNEVIQRDFCVECFDKKIKKKMKGAWNLLEKVVPIE